MLLFPFVYLTVSQSFNETVSQSASQPVSQSVYLSVSNTPNSSTSVCCHVLRMREVHVSLVHCCKSIRIVNSKHESTRIGCIGHVCVFLSVCLLSVCPPGLHFISEMACFHLFVLYLFAYIFVYLHYSNVSHAVGMYMITGFLFSTDHHYGRAVIMFGIPYVYTQSRILKVNVNSFLLVTFSCFPFSNNSSIFWLKHPFFTFKRSICHQVT